MSLRAYLITAGGVFTLVALMHLWRIVSGWPALMGSTSIPMSVSWFGLVFAGFLAFEAFRHARR